MTHRATGCGLVPIEALDWEDLGEQWRRDGFARAEAVLSPDACRALSELDRDPRRFRSRVVMERYRYGRGEYAYFAHPLPQIVTALREGLYPFLAQWANEMMAALGSSERYPPRLDALHARCRAAGQVRPTPLLLHYRGGDFNCLHRDLYGEVVFPLQAAAFLSCPGRDYAGGEFVLVENRPRQQSRVRVVPTGQGDLVIFPTDVRPVAGARGTVRAHVRHGVSEVTRGERWVLGLIFHDAA